MLFICSSQQGRRQEFTEGVSSRLQLAGWVWPNLPYIPCAGEGKLPLVLLLLLLSLVALYSRLLAWWSMGRLEESSVPPFSSSPSDASPRHKWKILLHNRQTDRSSAADIRAKKSYTVIHRLALQSTVTGPYDPAQLTTRIIAFPVALST